MKWNPTKARLLTVPAWIALLALAFACSSDSPSEPRQNPPPPPGSGGGSATFSVTVSVSPSALTAGSTNPAEVRVRIRRRDNGAPPASGTTAVVSTSLGDFGSAGSGNQQVVVSLVNGDALLQLFAGDQPGTAVVQAQYQGIVGQASISIQDLATFFLSLVDPATGSPDGGERVTIRGGGFARPLRVAFGNVGARVLSSTDSRIVIETPASLNPVGAGQTLPVNVNVTIRLNEAGQRSDTLTNGFTYVAGGGPLDRPVVLSVDPTAGPNEGGTQVILTGQGFQAPVQVLFGTGNVDNFTGLEGTVQSVNPNRIVVLSPPAGGIGVDNRDQNVSILVRNIDTGFATVVQSAFLYTTPIRISGFTPLEGPAVGGQEVRILGSGFLEPLQVTIGRIGVLEIEQTVLSVTPDEIVILTVGVAQNNCPADGVIFSGPFNVRLFDSGGPNNDTRVTSDQVYRYVVPTPQIFDVTPGSGRQIGNEVVLINGRGYDPPVRVTFESMGESFSGTIVTASPTTVQVRTPAITDVAFDEVACDDNNDGQEGLKFIPTAFDVTVENVDTGCTFTQSNGFTFNPTDGTCRGDVAPAPPPQCSDGIDNDGDGFIDGADPECAGPLDDDESM